MLPWEEEFEIVIIYGTRQTYKKGKKGKKKKFSNPPKILKQQVIQEENQHLKATCHKNRSPTPPFFYESQLSTKKNLL
jgi:hypothetical protein